MAARNCCQEIEDNIMLFFSAAAPCGNREAKLALFKKTFSHL
jgi:hypothetical protein